MKLGNYSLARCLCSARSAVRDVLAGTRQPGCSRSESEVSYHRLVIDAQPRPAAAPNSRRAPSPCDPPRPISSTSLSRNGVLRLRHSPNADDEACHCSSSSSSSASDGTGVPFAAPPALPFGFASAGEWPDREGYLCRCYRQPESACVIQQDAISSRIQ